MPRLSVSRRLPITAATALAMVLVASCTNHAADNAVSSASDKTAPSASPEPAKEAAEIVVTGTRIESRVQSVPVAVTAISSEDIGRSRSDRKAKPQRGTAAVPAPVPVQSFAAGIVAAPMVSPDRVAISPYYKDTGRDKFTTTAENPFKLTTEEPVSTFSLDVDTASYSFVRGQLNQNVLPQPAAVRTEEMVNYFPYDYSNARSAEEPFSTSVAVFPSPFTQGRKLVRIGVKGYEIQRATRPRANLVFLIDTSGSMNAPNKLPLVKQSLGLLLDQLGENDTVSIVTYAGYAGTALAPTPASQKEKIRAVIDQLGAGGGTAGAEGIRQAYTLAEQNLDPKGVNRVILATDGDFNVGITNQEELKGYVERERGKGVFLSVLGFGMGNYNDALMQTLAQNGNGAAAYIDTVSEARKTLVDEASSTLFPIAKDVKIQVEFNPAAVSEYRLIGYETRMLNREDFNNDKVDAGDVGSGQTVTAIYEIVPAGGPRVSDSLRYGRGTPATAPDGENAEIVESAVRIRPEIGFVKVRYKLPKSDTSRLISTPINASVEYASFEAAPRDARFATAVAGFSELLRGGKYSGTLTFDDVLRMGNAAKGEDGFGYRSEFLQMVRAAKTARSMASLGQ